MIGTSDGRELHGLHNSSLRGERDTSDQAAFSLTDLIAYQTVLFGFVLPDEN
jgi:hypothetical protein